MSGLQTQTEGVAPDISVSDNPPSSNQDTPDVVEETVVVVPDDQVINDENIPLEAADQISPTMKPKTQKRITELVKRGHEKDSVIKEKEDRIKELESRMASVESKTNEREVKEGQAIAEATLANLQKQREEAFEEQDFKKANELDLHIYKAAAQVNKLPIDDFDVVKYFKEKNNWYGVDIKKTMAADGIDRKVFNDAKYSNLSQREKLDEVARQTNSMFNDNPHSNSSPTDGAPISRPSKNTIYITQSDYAYLQKAHPEKSEKELLDLGKRLKKRMQG